MDQIILDRDQLDNVDKLVIHRPIGRDEWILAQDNPMEHVYRLLAWAQGEGWQIAYSSDQRQAHVTHPTWTKCEGQA